MTIFIALLKGINVGGHKKVPMAELRQLLNKEGFHNVRSYIQSGNVVLESTDTSEAIKVKIQDAMQSHFGFEVSVIVKTSKELKAIFDACPFFDETREKSYFIMLDGIPDSGLVKELSKISYKDETFVIKKDCLYFYAAAGYGQAKFNMNSFERKLKVRGTARNYNTMLKLVSMSSADEKDH